VSRLELITLLAALLMIINTVPPYVMLIADLGSYMLLISALSQTIQQCILQAGCLVPIYANTH
jgi:hypothetical protein